MPRPISVRFIKHQQLGPARIAFDHSKTLPMACNVAIRSGLLWARN
jgi:hypothetical protein